MVRLLRGLHPGMVQHQARSLSRGGGGGGSERAAWFLVVLVEKSRAIPIGLPVGLIIYQGYPSIYPKRTPMEPHGSGMVRVVWWGPKRFHVICFVLEYRSDPQTHRQGDSPTQLWVAITHF